MMANGITCIVTAIQAIVSLLKMIDIALQVPVPSLHRPIKAGFTVQSDWVGCKSGVGCVIGGEKLGGDVGE